MNRSPNVWLASFQSPTRQPRRETDSVGVGGATRGIVLHAVSSGTLVTVMFTDRARDSVSVVDTPTPSCPSKARRGTSNASPSGQTQSPWTQPLWVAGPLTT